MIKTKNELLYQMTEQIKDIINLELKFTKNITNANKKPIMIIFCLMIILSCKFFSDSFNKSKPDIPISKVPSPNL